MQLRWTASDQALRPRSRHEAKAGIAPCFARNDASFGFRPRAPTDGLCQTPSQQRPVRSGFFSGSQLQIIWSLRLQIGDALSLFDDERCEIYEDQKRNEEIRWIIGHLLQRRHCCHQKIIWTTNWSLWGMAQSVLR